MREHTLSIVAGALLLTACATPPSPPSLATAARTDAREEPAVQLDAPAPAPAPVDAEPQGGGTRAVLPTRWRPGDVALQGFLGASFYELSTTGGNSLALEDEDATLPTVGGGAQWYLAGDRVDFGFEGLLQFGWNGDVAGFVSSGGGAAVAVSVDLLIFDLYAGPFASIALGGRARAFAGAGPVLRWAQYDQEGPTFVESGDGDGFGVGYYARAGIEFEAARGTMLGFAARWSWAEMDLDGRLGDLDVRGIDAVVTITQGF